MNEFMGLKVAFRNELLVTAIVAADKRPLSSLHKVSGGYLTWVRICVLRFPVSANSFRHSKNGHVSVLCSPFGRLARSIPSYQSEDLTVVELRLGKLVAFWRHEVIL